MPFFIKVSLCHMACQVGDGIGGVDEVTFLYRLTPGACPKSYGVNVARLAGMWPQISLQADTLVFSLSSPSEMTLKP